MPQTKFQDLTFTCIMVLIFVYVMTFYNAGLENGVTFATFGYALTHMWVEVIGAFIAQRYIAAPIVKGTVSGTARSLADKTGTELSVRTMRSGILRRTARTPDLPYHLQETACSGYSLISPSRPSPRRYFL